MELSRLGGALRRRRVPGLVARNRLVPAARLDGEVVGLLLRHTADDLPGGAGTRRGAGQRGAAPRTPSRARDTAAPGLRRTVCGGRHSGAHGLARDGAIAVPAAGVLRELGTVRRGGRRRELLE